LIIDLSRWLDPSSIARPASALKTCGALVIDPQPDTAVNGVADRLRTQRAVDEEVGDPALGDAEAEPATIFEPALIADGRRDDAVTGHGRHNSGVRCEGLHEGAVDIALDTRAEQMRPLATDLDQVGSIVSGRDVSIERVERRHWVGI